MLDWPTLAAQLKEGLAALPIEVDEFQQQQLLDYVQLLQRWNQVYSLTAVRTPSQMISRHLLDSLALMPYVRGTRVLDVGSGPGLPGIPLAVCRASTHMTLLDSNAKKTRFLLQAVQALKLGNVEVLKQRVEAYFPTPRFDTVIARAFGSLTTLVRQAGHLVAPLGCLMVMKGGVPKDELNELGEVRDAIEVVRLQVPQVDAERHLVIISEAVLRACSNSRLRAH